MQDLKKTTESNYINRPAFKYESSYLGRLDYQKSLDIQNTLLQNAAKTDILYLVGLEHPAVLTMGLRADENTDIIKNQLPVFRVSRGGLATIHSEGQLVIYPIMNLKKLNLGVRDYVTLLMSTTQELLSEIGIAAQINKENMGLHTEKGKIAFCGIQVKNGISQHGLSINVRNDLSLFANIKSCGQQDAKLDSLAAYGAEYTLSELFDAWTRVFVKNMYINQNRPLHSP